MSKNIEMNYKDSGGYEVLYPATNITSVIDLQNQLNQKLSLTGGTMSGNLILNTSSPKNSLQAASKGYVDSGINNVFKKYKLDTKVVNQTTQVSYIVIPGISTVGFFPKFILFEVTIGGFSSYLNNGFFIGNSSGNFIYVQINSTYIISDYVTLPFLCIVTPSGVYTSEYIQCKLSSGTEEYSRLDFNDNNNDRISIGFQSALSISGSATVNTWLS